MLNDSNENVSQQLQEAIRDAAQQLSKEVIRGSLSSSIQLAQLSSVGTEALPIMSGLDRASAQGPASLARPDLLSEKAVGAQLEKSSILDGLVFSPIIKGLIGLFRGTPDAPPPSPEKYAYPSGSASTVAAAVREDGSASFIGFDGMGVSRRVTSSGPTIHINVDALDARSIMDRSDDIAAAIRQAVLSNSSLNDSLGEI